MELNGIRCQKWNAERVVILKSVILQRIPLVTGDKNICAQITAKIDLWNNGAFDELVSESYDAAMGYLERAYGNQNVVTGT